MAINSVEQVNVAMLKQNNTSASAAAKKAGKQYLSPHHKGTSNAKGSKKGDTIEISDEGKVLAGLLPDKNSKNITDNSII